MRLPDVNVVVNALRPDAPHHQICRSWLEEAVDDVVPVAVTGVVLSGAARVLTHPGIFDPPSDREPVLDELQRLAEHGHVVEIAPGPRHWAIYRALGRGADARGNLLADAWLAAIAIEHGCTFVTVDGDFARFEGLRWRRP